MLLALRPPAPSPSTAAAASVRCAFVFVFVFGTTVAAAGNVDEPLVHHPLVARVHALVYLVDDAEGGLGEGLHGHEVEDCADGAFAAGLALGGEELKALFFSAEWGNIMVSG